MRPIPTAQVLSLIHEFEQGPRGGFAPTPYNDPGGRPTIGFGHLIRPGESFPNPLTEQQADALAMNDLTSAATALNDNLGQELIDKLSDGQYAALLDFVFNEGIGHWNASSARRTLEAGVLQAVPYDLEKWVYGSVNGSEQILPGLVRRRAAEVAMWNA